MHADATVRAVAAEVLRRFMRAFPGRRNEVLVGMTAFATKIPDEFSEVRLCFNPFAFHSKFRRPLTHSMSCEQLPKGHVSWNTA